MKRMLRPPPVRDEQSCCNRKPGLCLASGLCSHSSHISAAKFTLVCLPSSELFSSRASADERPTRDGADGSWSTFAVRIGSPDPQLVNLLPGTSSSAGSSIWTVLPEGCTLAAPNVTTCEEDRGGLFFRNQSSTWSTERIANKGLFELLTFEESKLGLEGAAYYGFDTVQLGYDGSDGPVIENQLIAGMAGYDFWLGSLGLSPVPFNFSEFGDPVPSYLSNLREQKLVDSTSWAYTAGASYHDPPVFGSLTFGGHDTLRWDQEAALTGVPFGADSSRDLLIGLQSISYDTFGSSPLLSEGIYAFIDSMVTHLWLPVETCVALERAFNLTWNATDETYWISEDVHDQLIEQNPSLSFTLGPSSEPGGRTVDVVLPYSAFDLTMSPPFVQEPTRYFPLKRAQNSTQYTLGRVFLQEVYVIADYDRSTFTVAQALFPTPASAVDIVENATQESLIPGGSEPDSNSNGDLSKGAIAGIVVAVCVVVALVAVAAFWTRRRRGVRSDTKPPDGDMTVDEAAAKHGFGAEPYLGPGPGSPLINEMSARERYRQELPAADNSFRRSELSGKALKSQEYPTELVGSTAERRVFELGPS